jgi:leukotriene-A4 hydrolase
MKVLIKSYYQLTVRNSASVFMIFLLTLLLFSCNKEKKTGQKVQLPMAQDPHSYSAPSEARVKHLQWKATLDFENKIIQATAKWEIENFADADVVIFDIKDLQIKKVWLDESDSAQFKLTERDSILGQGLAVLIEPQTKFVTIQYVTSPDAEALQWLQPTQTAGKKYPFLFTQSQAILARSWVPCQDSPNIRFTYEAEVTGPKDLLILMSASNPDKKNESGTYNFSMKQAIPSYLLALTAGDLAFSAISNRCGIYAEPTMIDKSTWEFEDLEKMVVGAEELYGAYQWERYDVIVLPPSFPFGGMENPRITFATPTILAGDRSLTSLIAHELAHSWSGNLVTNATWNDFWLNEGFTVYFEHRIMEKLYGRDYSEMLAVLNLQDLNVTISDLKKDNLYQDTKLLLNLEDRNPDDGVTDIAYNKGYFFLRLIEETYGREKFDSFLKVYFSENAFHSMNTNSFIGYIKRFYKEKFNNELPETLFQEWIFTEGLPQSCPNPVSDRFTKVEDVLKQWVKTQTLNPDMSRQWSTQEWLHFIKNLPEDLTFKQMQQLDALGKFTKSGNAEIVCAWLVHCIRHHYEPAYGKLETFLVNTGRRKFLTPLYTELVNTEDGKKTARRIYTKARPNYHFVAVSTVDKLLQ